MSADKNFTPSRRALLGGAAAALGAAALPAWADTGIRANISSFRMLDWQPYFTTLAKGAILVDTESRALHYWSEDQMVYRLYPTSVPISADLTRKGRTEIIKKVVGPEWRPTPSMLERNPDWPDYIGPGPDNPLGARAMYLYRGGNDTLFRLHGTNQPWSIGQAMSSGCVRMFNQDVIDLFERVPDNTPIVVI